MLSSMPRKQAILATLFAMIAFGCGVFVGRHAVLKGIGTNSEKPQLVSKNVNTTNHSRVPKREKIASDSEKTDAPKLRSLEEIEALLADISTRTPRDRNKAIDDLVASVSLADMPKVLQLAEKTTPLAFRRSLRN